MEPPVPVSLHAGERGRRVIHFLASSPPLVPLLKADGEISPDVDRVLTMVAREAQTGDVAARNALFSACEPKIDRFVRRYRGILCGSNHSPAFDLDDVAQEAFVVFAELVDRWPGGDSFCVYFLGNFPWALRNRVRRLATANRAVSGLAGASGVDLLADGSAAADEATALVRAIADRLPPPDGSIMIWRVLDGDNFGTIARRLGTSRRTAMRAWDRIAAELRRSLAT